MSENTLKPSPIVVSFYKFQELKDLPQLQSDLKTWALSEKLKGTILLAAEGINGSISGDKAAVTRFLTAMAEDERIGPIGFKENPAEDATHRRMLVKIKKEIVTMHKENLAPQTDTGFFLSAEQFKQWCDEGKDMLLVDTRNDYEVALGQFKGALNPHTKSFSSFPEWVEKNLADQKDKTIVTYCTGGIRCEKATAYMKQQGYSQVYQIQGGILQYFADLGENNQAPHWEGECVVFDKRKAVGPDLQATKQDLCFICFKKLDKVEEDNKLPAGHLCESCQEKYEAKKAERQIKGALLQQAFRKEYKEHCLEVSSQWKEKISNG